MFHPSDEDPSADARIGDYGEIEFKRGGPSGGYWRFTVFRSDMDEWIEARKVLAKLGGKMTGGGDE